MQDSFTTMMHLPLRIPTSNQYRVAVGLNATLQLFRPVAVGHHNSRTQQSSWDGIDLIILPQQLPFHENDGARNIHIVSRVGSHVVCWVTILWFGWWFSLWSHRWFILLPTGPNLLTAGSEKETATFNLLIVWFIALSEYALKLRIGRRLWELVCRHLLERGVGY